MGHLPLAVHSRELRNISAQLKLRGRNHTLNIISELNERLFGWAALGPSEKAAQHFPASEPEVGYCTSSCGCSSAINMTAKRLAFYLLSLPYLMRTNLVVTYESTVLHARSRRVQHSLLMVQPIDDCKGTPTVP